jgi:chromosome partitioning protein
MQVVALANWKGGVGKTTSAANLALLLRERRVRVLLVDLDPQANLTESFGHLRAPELGVAKVLGGDVGLADVLLEVAPAVQLAPSSEALADLTWSLVRASDYRTRLRVALAHVEDRFDLALIDTPPGIGLWPGLALLSADAVVIPTRPHDSDVLATGKLVDYIEAEIRPANPGLRVLGALVTQVHPRWRLARETRAGLGSDEIPLFVTEIPASVRVAASLRTGAPLAARRPDHRVSMAYRRVASELLDRLGQEVAA